MNSQLKQTLTEYFMFQEYVVFTDSDKEYNEVLCDDNLQKYFTPIQLNDGVTGILMTQEVYHTLW